MTVVKRGISVLQLLWRSASALRGRHRGCVEMVHWNVEAGESSLCKNTLGDLGSIPAA